mmetsp:Transcript_6330/g.14983  ORF Transcript_6330/g.14983 Transcript_6330/m.14983 type:complete len:404 (+) Transcript_6330:281-1492(+)
MALSKRRSEKRVVVLSVSVSCLLFRVSVPAITGGVAVQDRRLGNGNRYHFRRGGVPVLRQGHRGGDHGSRVGVARGKRGGLALDGSGAAGCRGHGKPLVVNRRVAVELYQRGRIGVGGAAPLGVQAQREHVADQDGYSVVGVGGPRRMDAKGRIDRPPGIAGQQQIVGFVASVLLPGKWLAPHFIQFRIQRAILCGGSQGRLDAFRVPVCGPLDGFDESRSHPRDLGGALVAAAESDHERLRVAGIVGVVAPGPVVPGTRRRCRRGSVQQQPRLGEFGFECHGAHPGTPKTTATSAFADRDDLDRKTEGGIVVGSRCDSGVCDHGHLFLGIGIGVKDGIGFLEYFRDDFVFDLAFRIEAAERKRERIHSSVHPFAVVLSVSRVFDTVTRKKRERQQHNASNAV